MDHRPSRSTVKNRHSKSNVKNTPSSSGKLSRNPFINFLRDYRKSNKHTLNVVELTKRGAQLWRGMNDREKSPYVNLSKQAPTKYKQSRSRRRRGRRRGRRRSRRRRRRRRRHRSRSSSFTTEDSVGRSDHEKPEEKRKDRDSNERAKLENKPQHGTSKDRANTNNNNNNGKKGDEEYEVKYKNSKYEESRDFI